jgi:hypothetical protein
MTLRAAIANIHRDPLWWQKVLIAGALVLTIAGAPWPAGLVIESMDNARKGFPFPLPPWIDWSGRYVIGLLALLIDFVFFVFPVLIGGLLMLCGGLALAIGSESPAATTFILVAAAAIGAVLAVMFALSVAPVGRLLYIKEGNIEDAIGWRTIRQAVRPGVRKEYLRTRLHSLPAYLPALALGLASWLVWQSTFPGALLLGGVLTWLTLSALIYAHLVVAQLYAPLGRIT